MTLDPALLSLLGFLVAALVRIVSNARVVQLQKQVATLQKQLDTLRDENIKLEDEKYKLKRELSRHGIEAEHVLALPNPDAEEEKPQ